ncbi:hypothetical protein DDQ50_03680 [Amnibacterium flavum]|uniref:Uncharacterized protein n=1 Tax=Amnibacterium flavum TaxID=2173173 RepID=A0A2V1HSM6_9MICO|nr:hypothetical protein DDQ50_03680 [Amnibacterium flavum]
MLHRGHPAAPLSRLLLGDDIDFFDFRRTRSAVRTWVAIFALPRSVGIAGTGSPPPATVRSYVQRPLRPHGLDGLLVVL